MNGSLNSLRDETQESLQLIHDIYSETPSLWVEDYFGLILDSWQVQMLDSPKNRICLNIHRQGGKSTMAALICLHTALFKPNSLSLIVAPALRQSQENFKKIRAFIDQLLERPRFDESTKLSMQFNNGSRIITLPGGNEGKTIRGFSRPDIIIEDESAQCADELYDALSPMMATNPSCKFILCSTPFGQIGHFFKTYTDGGPEWLKIKLTGPDNPRISKEFLEEQRKDGTHSPLYFAQEYLCEFTANESNLFHLDTIIKARDSLIPIIDISKM
jgi:hypothetical protein